MTRDEIDLQQSDDMDLLVEIPDQVLEATCGGLLQGPPTLAFGSYCSPVALFCIEDSARGADQATANRWRWM
jgi:hypothetical protein